METDELIGQEVMNRSTKARGVIRFVGNGRMTVSYFDWESSYEFPSALDSTLILKDRNLQKKYEQASTDSTFDNFKRKYKLAIEKEVSFLKQSGGKKYRAMDGKVIANAGRSGHTYIFETDSELHLLEGSSIKIWYPERIILSTLVSCEDFSIVLRTQEALPEPLENITFTCDAWQLLNALEERLEELDARENPIAFQLACRGRSQIDRRRSMLKGQAAAQRIVDEQPITIIWGPPGTGKTRTLANIALGFIKDGKRVLMLSYSNVSVDGALLRVADMSETEYVPGEIVRYGYPRDAALIDNNQYTSYKIVLNQNPELKEQYDSLREKRRRTGKKSAERVRINRSLHAIREQLREAERELVQNARFLATTVSKATADKAIYTQMFDIVLFDEASMAYIPQVVFAASLAKERFVCLGDFRQLPAIVQEPSNSILEQDIFEYTGITEAVEEGYSHKWLVMLDHQYRMHRAIADFVGKNMYGGNLESDKNSTAGRQKIADIEPAAGEPISLFDLGGTYSVCVKMGDGSHVNLLSALLCMRIAELCHTKYEIGIITPYSGQSRLILAMKRDLEERNRTYGSITCSTVHQFQGSEKPVIIYDAVDCYRMPYPGVLLTSKKNDTSNRLFNVALTRTEGKFIMVANADYLFRKKISKTLLFTKMLRHLSHDKYRTAGEEVINELTCEEQDMPEVFVGDRDDWDSWNRYLADLDSAENEIHMEIPGLIDDDPGSMQQISAVLENCRRRDVDIEIRHDENVMLPSALQKYERIHDYVTTPFTVIDRETIWFGEPLCAADFISEGDIITTEYFPCVRFVGKHTARILKAIYNY